MDFALQPVTDPGRRFVALCEEHAADFATRAERHDRENSFPFENIQALLESRTLAACVPEEFGGLGVASAHDTMVGINRLGRGDGATAIAANMQITAGWGQTRRWRAATAAGDALQAGPLEGFLRMLGDGRTVFSFPFTEPGAMVGFPLAEATAAEGGWVLNGRKTFATLSPAAQLFLVLVRVAGPDGAASTGFAVVPRGTAGLEVQETWDALGMRASGSHDILLTDCRVPAEAVQVVSPWGAIDEAWIPALTANNISLVAVSLGIAEAARDLIVEQLATRRKAPSNRLLAERYPIQHGVAEIEIALAACRALLDRTFLAADAYFAAHPADGEDLAELHQLFKDCQCTKQFVTRAAIEAVDRALTLSGGTGYLSKSPLSRLYRDVRAGPFMQAYSPNEAFEYIGKVALGLDPTIDL